MYSLDCNYFTKEFSTLRELINELQKGEMDPNYDITFNGKKTGEQGIDHIVF